MKMTEAAVQAPVETPISAPVVAPAVAPAAEASVSPSPAGVAPAPVTAVTPEPVKADAPPAWPENWRDLMANGDEKFRKQLDRVSSPLDVAKNYRSLELKKGEMFTKLKPDATPEEVTQFRKDNGIPETFDKYDTNLPDGMVFGETDKPFLDKYLTEMHAKNASPEAVKAGLVAYHKIIEEQAVQYVQRDLTDKTSFEDAMRSEWGTEYRANINMIGNFLNAAPEQVKEAVLNGRDGQGRALMNQPDFVRWMNGLVREINPAAALVPSNAKDASVSVDEELGKIAEYRKANLKNGQWHKNDTMRSRERQLLEAKEKMAARK
jgi:hypothetical protein